jgi:hypothetical protein
MAAPTSGAEPSSTTTTTTSGGAGRGWRQKSNRLLAAVAAVILIVVLLGGMAIGYAIEKGRVDNKTTTVAKKKTTTTKKKKATVARLRIAGTVSNVSGGKLTITPKKGAKRVVSLQKTTVIVKAGSGAASDIAATMKVLYSGTSFTNASNIIVLPKTSALGVAVVKAGTDSMMVKAGKKNVTISTKGAAVDKTSAAKAADVTKGTKVMILTTRFKGAVLAVEIIVLSGNSPFA